MKRSLKLVAAVLLIFLTAACSRDEPEGSLVPLATIAPATSGGVTNAQGTQGQPAPTSPSTSVQDTAPPTATLPAPTDPPASSEVASAPSIDANALEQLRSYRSQIVWRVRAGDVSLQEMQMEIAQTANPPARHISLSGNQGDFQMVQIEDNLWINAGGQWQSIPASVADSMIGGQLVFTPENLNDLTAGDLDNVTFLGREEINDIQTNRYQITLDPAQLAQTTGGGNVSDVNAEIWVADQADLPAFAMRMTVSYQGSYEGQADTTFDLHWEVSDVNADFTIEQPG